MAVQKSGPRAVPKTTSPKGEKASAAKPAASRMSFDEWRDHIANALYHCVRKQGYAFISLNALATEAGISASHLRYYFEGKEAVLEYYVEHLCDKLRIEMDVLQGLPAAALIDGLAEFHFGPKVSTQRLGVMHEIFALTLHHPRMRQIKAQYDVYLRGLLVQVFASGTQPDGAAMEAEARIGYALLEGFLQNAVFDKDVKLAETRALFVRTMRDLAGVEG
jgi:AcrR family transcriptional regulator